MAKRVEVVGWHSIVIEMVNKDANCSLEVLTTLPSRLVGALADPDVVAVSWETVSRVFMVKTEHIARVIVEEMEAEQLDDEDREELLETAIPTTASVMVRTRTQDKDGRWWSYLWPKDTP